MANFYEKTTMKKPYIELLKDPRWQKKRLELFKLDGFQCRDCGSKDNTLHVHHLYYEKGKNPWEYDFDVLITLCERCHERAPKINWQRAFLDLNLCEAELLDVACMFAFIKRKRNLELKEVLDKHGCRDTNMVVNFGDFDSEEELDEYFTKLRPEFKQKYTES